MKWEPTEPSPIASPMAGRTRSWSCRRARHAGEWGTRWSGTGRCPRGSRIWRQPKSSRRDAQSHRERRWPLCGKLKAWDVVNEALDERRPMPIGIPSSIRSSERRISTKPSWPRTRPIRTRLLFYNESNIDWSSSSSTRPMHSYSACSRQCAGPRSGVEHARLARRRSDAGELAAALQSSLTSASGQLQRTRCTSRKRSR